MKSMFVIEQDRDSIALAVQLVGNAAMSDVRLVALNLTNSGMGETGTGMLDARYSFEPGAAESSNEELRLQTKFRCAVVAPGASDETEVEVFHVACTLETRYLIRPDFKPTPEQIAAFHAGNCIFNSWPFFRELVQSMATRASLPPPPVPFLRLQPRNASEPPAGSVADRKRKPTTTKKKRRSTAE